MAKTVSMLEWRPTPGGGHVAEMGGDDDYLLIDHDDSRPGDAKWYLTWFHTEEHPSGLIIRGGHGADGLKAYAEAWVGE